MEKELEHLLKQKDDQLRSSENKWAASERSRQGTQRDLELAQQEIERLQSQVEQLRSESAGKMTDHQRSVEQLTVDYQRRVEDLEEQRSLEARQKHELTLSLRSVEELWTPAGNGPGRIDQGGKGICVNEAGQTWRNSRRNVTNWSCNALPGSFAEFEGLHGLDRFGWLAGRMRNQRHGVLQKGTELSTLHCLLIPKHF
eukprot:g4985.t1